MNVMVISKRVFRVKHRDKLAPLLQKLRDISEKQPGFISRTTYSKLNDPGEYIVVSKWETADAWGNCMGLKEAKEIQWQIDSLIGERTSFELYKAEDF